MWGTPQSEAWMGRWVWGHLMFLPRDCFSKGTSLKADDTEPAPLKTNHTPRFVQSTDPTMAQRGLTVKPPKAAVSVAALLRLVEGLAGQGRAGSPGPWALRRSPPCAAACFPGRGAPAPGC